jgi:putative selenium metabolism protein SsnA
MRMTLANATLCCLEPRRVESGSVTVEDGLIVFAGPGRPDDPGQVVDCGGRLLMPGNVCAHTHLYSSLARGVPPPARPPRDFLDLLRLIWWRLDRALDEESVMHSALVGLLDAARCGTTTLIDHHSSPNSIAGSLDVEAEAFESVGLRGVLCYEVTDRNGPAGTEAGLRENDRFLRGSARRLLRGTVGAHASMTLEPQTLRSLADLADQHSTGVHIHVAEDLADQTGCMSRYRSRVVQRLDSERIVRDKSILAHCVHLDGQEVSLVKQRGAWVAHNCRSNLNNSVGRAPIHELGDRVVLGTDGIDGDMFGESHNAYWRAREDSLDAAPDWVTGMLARGGDLAAQFFGIPLGTMGVGAGADLVLVDYDPPTPLASGALAWHWMFGMGAHNVTDVMVDGRWIIRDRRFVTVDEEKIRAEARQAARRLWERMESV